jgi:hypothetical protein
MERLIGIHFIQQLDLLQCFIKVKNKIFIINKYYFFFHLIESLDALKDAVQLGIINGEQRKTKELLCWARRKQRRHIRTEEVYDYLIGRPPYRFASRPYNSNSSLTTTEIGSTNSGTTNSSSVRRQDSTTEVTTNQNQPVVDDLQTFRQALVMHGIEFLKKMNSFFLIESIVCFF